MYNYYEPGSGGEVVQRPQMHAFEALEDVDVEPQTDLQCTTLDDTMPISMASCLFSSWKFIFFTWRAGKSISDMSLVALPLLLLGEGHNIDGFQVMMSVPTVRPSEPVLRREWLPKAIVIEPCRVAITAAPWIVAGVALRGRWFLCGVVFVRS